MAIKETSLEILLTPLPSQRPKAMYTAHSGRSPLHGHVLQGLHGVLVVNSATAVHSLLDHEAGHCDHHQVSVDVA